MYMKKSKKISGKPKKQKIRFEPPKGTRDFLPDEMKKRNWVFNICRNVFEKYGYGEVKTPAFESLELLECKGSLGGDAVKDIYRFTDKSDRKLGLIYEPTTPIARIIANKPDLPKPIRWYYITRMWRYEDVGKGHYREFWQAGCELAGTDDPASDAEIIQLTVDCLLALGIKDFTIRVNNRKILDSIAKKLKIENKENVFRILDKLDKKGEKEVKQELKNEINAKQIAGIFKFIKSDISKVRELGGVKELKNIINLLDDDYKKFVKVDFSIARGLDYYTDFIFETIVKGFEELGSVASGGRYDDLIKKYGGKATPAVGFGIGIERIMRVLEKSDLIKLRKSELIYVAPVNESIIKSAMEVCKILRNADLVAELGFASKSLSKHLNYANSKHACYVVIVGPEDLKENKVTIRDMKTGDEKKAVIPEVGEEIKKLERLKIVYG